MHISGNVIVVLMPLPVANVAQCDTESWEWPGDEAAYSPVTTVLGTR